MRIKKRFTQICLLPTLLIASNAYSESVNETLSDMHRRLQKLESSAMESTAKVQLHGLVEVEYGYSEDYAGTDGSDIVLATVELGVEAAINDNVDASVVLFYEEDDTPLELDVGVIDLHDESSPGSISLGQMYVPFGAFESNMISDPLTLEIGETRASTILFNYVRAGMSAGFYVFNGNFEEGADEDKANQFGLSLAYENASFQAGVDYISALSDSFVLTDHLANTAGVSSLVNQVAGLSAHAAYHVDNSFSVIFEYVGALDKYDATEMVFNGVGAEPSAMNLEFAMPVADATVALAYQTTDEAIDLGLPETRIMLVYSKEVYDATSLAFEYARDSDYDVSDSGSAGSGTGETGFTFTVQLATEF